MSAQQNIYSDIAARTGGNVYVGVVGPVRTGKSTFIKRFMEQLVLPNIEDSYERERARDEMPQTAGGRTVMTTEPKFVPDEAVRITVGGSTVMRVKLADCVGYVVPDALGTLENGQSRMVLTPWSESPMPFEQAAEMGTKKVITEHSTVGILVTTDGTIGELPRQAYVEAEKRVASELKALGKPFAVLLNSAEPSSERAVKLAMELEKSYGVPVALVSAIDLNAEDIRHLMELILLEFPIKMIDVELPSWTRALGDTHPLVASVREKVAECASGIRKLGQIESAFNPLFSCEYVRDAYVTSTDLATGATRLDVKLKDQLYYGVLSELTGLKIDGEESLVSTIRSLAAVKERYDKIEQALDMAESSGYGIVMPSVSDLTLAEPEIIKRSGSYGVKLKASAPSIHMIKANIETEINPIVGTEQQSEDLIRYLLSEFDESPEKIWSSNLFGKTLYELVAEGLSAKLGNMPDEARAKLGQTLEKIVNDGSGGLICILL